MKRLLAIFLMLFPCVALGDMQFFGGGGGGVTAPVSVANGGTGAAPSGDDQILVSDSSSSATWRTIGDCVGTGKAITYTAATNSWGCNTITAGIAGSTGATDNAVLRADGTGGATLQNSLMVVDDSGNVTGAVSYATSADPADAGAFRLGNAEQICWEASPAGTDVCISVNSAEVLQVPLFNATTGGTLGGGTYTVSNGIRMDFGAFSTGAGISGNQTLTPDSAGIQTFPTSNSFHINEQGDVGFDFTNGPCGTSACTNPNLIVHAATQDTTNYQALNDSGLSGSFRKTLTESSATTIAQITVPAASGVSGQLLYTVFAKDATNSQVRSGRVIYSVVSEGTTATCVLGTPEEIDNTPTGTLTAAITCDTATANLAKLQINAVSSLTQTTLESYGTIIHVGSGEMLPQ